jgi:hypothetical protein
MKTVFKKSTTNWKCYVSEKKQDNYIFKEDFTIEEFLATEIPLKDKGLFIRHNCDLTDNQFRKFAIGCALCVLPIYENKYPGNNAPREAIEAAKAYLEGKITLDDLFIKRKAYAAAAADVEAAYFAHGTPYAAEVEAAYFADASAHAAATIAATAAAVVAAAARAEAVVAAAAAVVDIAAYAAEKNDYKTFLLDFFKEFTTIK